MNKAFLAGKIYNVMNIYEFYNNRNYYDDIAIINNGYIYPLRNSEYNDDVVGFYKTNVGYMCRQVRTEEEKETYSINHMACFNSAESLKEIVQENEKLEADQMAYLMATSDNIFKPVIDSVHDTPLMIGFKQAVIDKGIDINKYASRFGSDFNNDRRKFNANKISLDKFISIGTNLDMKATVIIEDANKNVPNPIGRKIIVDLFPNDGGKNNE